jgi:hypothetical protein
MQGGGDAGKDGNAELKQVLTNSPFDLLLPISQSIFVGPEFWTAYAF